SVACFGNDRPFLAAFCGAAAAALHATYLLGAALLTGAYMLVLVRQRAWQKALGVGALALAVVTPTVLYSWLTFGPSSSAAFARAEEILVHFRVAHHAEPRVWFNAIALAQIGWIGLALWLTRGTQLGAALLIVSLFSL